jgi:hypothetical protein
MGPLTIAAGQARYSGFSRVTKEGFEGTVGPQGELALRLAADASQSSLGVEIITRGIIDGNGAIRRCGDLALAASRLLRCARNDVTS